MTPKRPTPPLVLTLVVALAASAACSDEAGGNDGASDLRAALAAAEPGDVVAVTTGTYAGPLEVGPGVTLRAEGPGHVTIVQTEPGAALTIHSGAAGETVVEGLRVVSEGTTAVLVRGEGAVAIRRVSVEVSRGFGLIAEGTSVLRLEGVSLGAQVSDPRALRYPIDPAQFPTVGLGLADIAQVELVDLEIFGFAGFGALLIDSQGTWTGGEVRDNIGVGVLQAGGAFELDGVSITGTVNCEHASCAQQNQVFGLAFVSDAGEAGPGQLTTQNCDISENDGIGYFQSGGISFHEGLVVHGNQHVGIWLQDVHGTREAPAFDLTGEGSEVSGNGGAGVVALRSGGICIDSAVISGTVPLPIATGQTSSTTMADGIQIVDPTGEFTLRQALINTANAAGPGRVGLLVQAAIADGLTLEDVTIEGVDGNGLVLQGGVEADPGWEVSVDEGLAVNDAAIEDPLAVAVARTGIPSVAVVGENGLIGPEGVVGENGLIGPEGVVGENGVVGGED